MQQFTKGSYLYSFLDTITPEPTSFLVRAFEQSQFICILHHTPVLDPPLFQPNLTFSQYIHSLEEWEQNLLKHHELLLPPNDIMRELNRGPNYVASDGSVIHNKASYGYIIASSSIRRLVKAN